MGVITPDRDLAKLQPEMRERVERFLKACDAHGIRVKISEAWRSDARQAYLYAFGRFGVNKTKAPVTWVKHSLHQDGLAVDVYFDNNKDIYEGDWDLLFTLAEECGLESLYKKEGVDKPHLQFNESWVRRDGERYKDEEWLMMNNIITVLKNIDGCPNREEVYAIVHKTFSKLQTQVNNLKKEIRNLKLKNG